MIKKDHNTDFEKFWTKELMKNFIKDTLIRHLIKNIKKLHQKFYQES